MYFLKDLFLLICREREKEREREGEKINVWLPLACPPPPPGDLACIPGMCPDWVSKWQPFGLQAHAQSTVPHQPGPQWSIFPLLWGCQAEFWEPSVGRLTPIRNYKRFSALYHTRSARAKRSSQTYHFGKNRPPKLIESEVGETSGLSPVLAPPNWILQQITNAWETLSYAIPPNQNKSNNLKDLKVCTGLKFIQLLSHHIIGTLFCTVSRVVKSRFSDFCYWGDPS